MLKANQVYRGNCLERMQEIDDESVDAVITDPPAAISFMGATWDSNKGGRDQWIAWLQEIMEECNRVLKPGAHIIVWALPRTSHWTRMAVDNAGFEIRHIIDHVFASGFPKSQNIGKKYDQLMGNKGTSQWESWGSALKPGHEDWILARKPLSEKSIVENCIKHGTGALNIDGCRIPTSENDKSGWEQSRGSDKGSSSYKLKDDDTKPFKKNNTGRFPADIIVSDDALNDGEVTTGKIGMTQHGSGSNKIYGKYKNSEQSYINNGVADSGSKSRYFDLEQWAEKNGIIYCSKPSKKERGEGNDHPTCKSLKLMSWLVILVTKEGDTVLDPFIGSGTTAVAAKKLNRNFIGIELEPEYIEIAKARIWGTRPTRE